MCALLDSEQFPSYIIYLRSGIVPLKKSFHHLFPARDRTCRFHARADHIVLKKALREWMREEAVQSAIPVVVALLVLCVLAVVEGVN
ncbi:uncharacterized protein G2W53_016264 [Senna tora]|uniref:Uncharacterized protein n=1 Tax=Senna tora TaxID=362788 RepID=A0A834TR86_9FABA|nr:uncharacterized protein G2W53_016264 [Senna tora]